ncbi:hypothetical protein ACGFYP_16960 [Streptomyces sp. NPDC048370]|uniref:hypothetical protein n=1 Tax=Streptomyces sp. NPDC048370 TaxID=3365540 RepID=UPI00371C92C2
MPARSRRLTAALGLAALTSVALATAPASQAADDTASVVRELATATAATAKYASEALAIKDGYLRTDVCVASPEGGMGYHYVNPKYIGSVDPRTPAAILYEDGKGGKRKLVAVEYVVPYTGQPAPKLFGRAFDGPDPIPELGPAYDRHVWLFKKNPKGLFNRWNPKVTCPNGAATHP